MAEWGDKGQDAARESLWIDFGFLTAYGTFLTLALAAVRDRARERGLAAAWPWRSAACDRRLRRARGRVRRAQRTSACCSRSAAHGSAFPVLATIFASIKFFFVAVADRSTWWSACAMWVLRRASRPERLHSDPAAALPSWGGGVELLVESLLRAMESHLRHPPRGCTGPGQARGRARST